MKNNEDISQRLRKIRKHLEQSQVDFSFKLGITQQTYSLIERGVRAVNVKVLVALGELFNVNLNWLIFNAGEMFNSNRRGKEELHERHSRLIEITKEMMEIIKQDY